MTTVGIKVDGLQALLKQLRDVGLASETATLEVITDIVTDTHALAVAGIQGGPKSGKVYGRHQSSAPGQYPASDTGRLAGGVRMVMPTEASMTGQVGTNVAYGPHLEFGTSKMAARPWLLPSFERAKIGVEKELRARLEAKI
jgi:hypothetical protein